MTLAIPIAMFLLSLFFGSSAQDSPPAKSYDIDEAYQIYSLLLPHEESYGFAKDTIVIQEDTVSHPVETACFDPKSVSKFNDALADYKSAQTSKWLLGRRFQIEKNYEIVNSDTINLMFKEHGVEGWRDFYSHYLNSGGFIIMSPVGFNKAKTLAVVYTGSSCGGLCGSWRFHLLEKLDGKWKEVPGVTCSTVS